MFPFAQTFNPRRINLQVNPNSRKLATQTAVESKVVILYKSTLQVILVMLTAISPLFAQTCERSAAKPESNASILIARQIMELSIAATERNWLAWDHYAYIKLDEDRHLDSLGNLKSEDADLTKTFLVNGAHFGQLIEHNGHPPSAEERRRNARDLDKLKRATPEERTDRLHEEDENRSFLRDVLKAFDFQLIGEEIAEGRPAYVLQATPHKGYIAHGKYGKVFPNVEGKFWVDKRDFGWIKVEGNVTRAFSVGLFLARVQRGTHIRMVETCVGDDVWVPNRIDIRASATILFLKNLDIDRVLTYSDYTRVTDGPYLADR